MLRGGVGEYISTLQTAVLVILMRKHHVLMMKCILGSYLKDLGPKSEDVVDKDDHGRSILRASDI